MQHSPQERSCPTQLLLLPATYFGVWCQQWMPVNASEYQAASLHFAQVAALKHLKKSPGSLRILSSLPQPLPIQFYTASLPFLHMYLPCPYSPALPRSQKLRCHAAS